MEIGKLKNETLGEIVLSEIKSIREDILIRPNVGEDCAAIAFGDLACVLTTDPITGSGSQLGHLAVHVCLNDIASSGAEAVGILLTLLCPEGTSEESIQDVLREANRSANAMGAEIVGGHTEITSAVNRMVISATAIGKTLASNLIKTSGAGVGDLIYLTKQAATEGTAIIAHDKAHELTDILSKDELEYAKALMNEISVVKEGRIGALAGASAMHDATEGGVLGAIHELCEASGKGCIIERDAIKILPITQKIGLHFNIDPYKLIASGTMVITISKEKSVELERLLSASHIEYACVGIITGEGQKVMKVIQSEGATLYEPILAPESDELYKVV